MEMKNKMVQAIWRALEAHETVSVMGDSKYETVSDSNYNDFISDVTAGRYDNARIDLAYDDDQEVPELIVVFIGLNNGKDEVKMNNQTEVKTVVNERKDDVKMNRGFNRFEGKKDDTMMVAKVNAAVNNNPKFRIAVIANNAEPEACVVAVDMLNKNFLLEAVRTHKWSAIWNKATDYAFFNYYIAKDGIFTLETSMSKLDKTPHISIKNEVSIDKQNRKDDKQMTDEKVIVRVPMVAKTMEQIINELEVKAYADAKAAAQAEVEQPVENLGNLAVDVLPSYNIDNCKSVYLIDDAKAAQYAKVAPVSNLETADKLQVALLKLIKEVVGAKRLPEGRNRLNVKYMMFLDLTEFCKTGCGISYKPVAQNWLFEITGEQHYAIVYNVPSEDTLRAVLNKGIIVNMPTGEWKEEVSVVTGKVIKTPVTHETLINYAFSSASKQRTGAYVFTDIKDIQSLRDSLVFYSDEFKLGKKVSVAKAESRVGQNTSNGLLVGGMAPYTMKKELIANGQAQFVDFWYVVVPDISLADVKRAAGQEVLPGDEDIIVIDGSGEMNEKAYKILCKKTGNKDGQMLQVRAGKGTLRRQVIADQNIIARAVEAKLGIKIKEDHDAIFYITESMWKFSVGIDILPVVVLHASEEIVDYSKFCYQYLQTINLSSQEGRATLIALAKETADMLYVNENTPPHVVMDKIGVINKTAMMDVSIDENGNEVEDDSDLMENKALAASLFRAFAANPELAMRSAYLIAKVNDLFKKQIADIARGRVIVKGCYHFMAMDPGVFAGKTYLKAGQCYAGGYVGKVSLHRSPNIAMGEAQVLEAVDIPELAQFKDLNIVFFNAFDGAWLAMQGADFDGDKCFVCKDERIIKLVIHGIEVPEMPKPKALSVVLTKNEITEYYCTSFRYNNPDDRKYAITTGRVVNLATTILAKAHANGTFMSEKTINEILEIAKAVNDIIDAPKTGVRAQFGKYFTKQSFDINDKNPNFLSKSKTINPWDVETTETNEKSRYYKDMVSPLGRLCNVTTPYLYERFTFKRKFAFKVNDLLEYVNTDTYHEVYNQVGGYKSLYTKSAREIAETYRELGGISSDMGSMLYELLCKEVNEKLRGMAAQYDMLTVALACIAHGEDSRAVSGFAYKCFEEGVIALFQAVEGKSYRMLKRNQEAPEGSEVVSVGRTRYVVETRKAIDKQQRIFNSANVGKQVTIRVTGLQYELTKEANTMNKLIACIKKANNLVHCGESGRVKNDGSKEYIMLAGNQNIGVVYTDRDFGVATSFINGGYAVVKAVNFVKSAADRAMDPKAYAAKLDFNGPISYADITVEYTDKPVNDKKAEKSSESTVSAKDFVAVDSTFVLPSAFGVAVSPLQERTVGASAPASNPSTIAGGLNEMFGNKSQSAKDNSMPDFDFASSNCPEMDDEYYASLYADME